MTKLEELEALLNKVGSPSRRGWIYGTAKRLGKEQEVIDFIKENNIDYANADDEENPDCYRAYLDYLKLSHFGDALEAKYGYDLSEDDIDEDEE